MAIGTSDQPSNNSPRRPDRTRAHHSLVLTVRQSVSVRACEAGEMARRFVLNTGAEIPSVGLGTWQSKPDVVGDSVYAAVKVRMAAPPIHSPLPPLYLTPPPP